MDLKPRTILAPNASPMTMAGTVTYLIGRSEVAIIDPGSASDAHIDTIADEVRDATAARILLTHDHPDHATGARELGRRLDAPVFSAASGTLADGGRIPTDQGDLITLLTPGHAPDHAAFHWPAAAAIFCGDLMMGGMDTAVVAAPEGDVGLYLESLARLEALRPQVIYPAHGPPFTEPDVALSRYKRHREDRERQVLAALSAGARSAEEIADYVYGKDMHPDLRRFALGAIQAYMLHLYTEGRLPEGVET